MQLSRSALAKGCSKQQQVVVATPIAAQAAQCCSFCVIWACWSFPSCSMSSCWIMHTHGHAYMLRAHACTEHDYSLEIYLQLYCAFAYLALVVTQKIRFRKLLRSYLDQNLLRITNPVSDLTGDQQLYVIF
jgi:hypothetical protein